MSRHAVKWISVVGSIASIIGVALYFFASNPASPPTQSILVRGANSMNVIAGRDATVTIDPYQFESPKLERPKPISGEVDYRKLASQVFSRQFVGETVVFRALFLSEWSLVDAYRDVGISTNNLLFLNHRDVEYVATKSPLASSDIAFPPFPLSLPLDQANIIYSLHRGDIILVEGKVEQTRPKSPYHYHHEFAKIYVRATAITKIESN